MSLRRNPSRTIASWTTAAVSGRTPGSSLTTRDTVLRLTPAAWATSAIVGRALPSSSLAAVSVTLLDNVVNGAPATGRSAPRLLRRRGYGAGHHRDDRLEGCRAR